MVGLTTSSFYSILLRKTLPFGPNSRKNRNKMLPQVVVGLQIHDAVVSWRVVVLEKKCLESEGRQMTQIEGLTSTASVSCKTGGTAVGVGCFFRCTRWKCLVRIMKQRTEYWTTVNDAPLTADFWCSFHNIHQLEDEILFLISQTLSPSYPRRIEPPPSEIHEGGRMRQQCIGASKPWMFERQLSSTRDLCFM